MNIRQFECLRAIMTTGSMTQAAESLGISQPSASSLIANLEHTLGFKLFKRVKGRLVPTPEARHFLPDVARALDSIDLALQKARQIRDNRHGDLTIASYPDIAVDFLPKVLSQLVQGERSIRMRLLARRSEMMSGLLPTQEFDIAIVTQVAEARHMEVEEIRMPCFLACVPDSPLAGRQYLSPGDLRDARLVTLMPNHQTVVQLAERFSQERVPFPGAAIEAQTFESACGFIRRGAGVGLLDPLTATRYGAAELALRRFEPEVFLSIFLLTPADRPRSQLLARFRELLGAKLQEAVECSEARAV